MFTFRPVPVARHAFWFCRWSVALALWAAVIGRLPWLAAACAAVMAASAVLTVRRAPLIALYTATVHRLWPSPIDVLDEHGMRFAHTVATVFIGAPLLVIALAGPAAAEGAWRFLVFVAVFKTSGALGYCAISRLWTCAISGGACCAFLRPRARE